MKRCPSVWCLLLAATLNPAAFAAPAAAAVNVERHGAENPVVEVARSTLYGALAGLVLGSAIALAASDDSGEAIRWGTVAGTFIGLGAGIYFVSSRPKAGALLELDGGRLRLNPLAVVEVTPEAGTRVRLIGARF